METTTKTENPNRPEAAVPTAPQTNPTPPQTRHRQWEALGWVHVIQPMAEPEFTELGRLGCFPSGYTKANPAPRGSSCDDGDPDRGIYVPASWLVGDDDFKAAEMWKRAGEEQGVDIEGHVLIAIPRLDGTSVVTRYHGGGVCDSPYLIIWRLKAVANPEPPPPTRLGGILNSGSQLRTAIQTALLTMKIPKFCEMVEARVRRRLTLDGDDGGRQLLDAGDVTVAKTAAFRADNRVLTSRTAVANLLDGDFIEAAVAADSLRLSGGNAVWKASALESLGRLETAGIEFWSATLSD